MHNLISPHSRHFRDFPLAVNMFTTLGLQEWHINLPNQCCLQPVSAKASIQNCVSWGQCLILHFFGEQVYADDFWGASLILWCDIPSLITLETLHLLTRLAQTIHSFFCTSLQVVSDQAIGTESFIADKLTLLCCSQHTGLLSSNRNLFRFLGHNCLCLDY